MFTEEGYPSDQHAKAMLVEYGRRMYEHGYVVTNDGNISVKVSPTEIWVTPTAVSKGFMTPEMMVKMDLDGNILEGERKPSSEVKMHLRVYKENKKVRGVVHAHPTNATSFAIAGIPLDDPILVESMLQLGAVPVARYAKPGTYDVPDSIAPYCKDYNAVLLSNHGALTWGESLMQAYYRMEVLETYAAMELNVRALNQKRRLSTEQIAELQQLRDTLELGSAKMPKGCDAAENLTDIIPQTNA